MKEQLIGYNLHKEKHKVCFRFQAFILYKKRHKLRPLCSLPPDSETRHETEQQFNLLLINKSDWTGNSLVTMVTTDQTEEKKNKQNLTLKTNQEADFCRQEAELHVHTVCG